MSQWVWLFLQFLPFFGRPQLIGPCPKKDLDNLWADDMVVEGVTIIWIEGFIVKPCKTLFLNTL
jgi:hypothetical protein